MNYDACAASLGHLKSMAHKSEARNIRAGMHIVRLHGFGGGFVQCCHHFRYLRHFIVVQLVLLN
ncbi:hypothetical protein D3C86_2145820 [compost metagenome]